MATFITGPARLALAARRPTPIGKELLLFSAHSFNVQRSWNWDLDLWRFVEGQI